MRGTPNVRLEILIPAFFMIVARLVLWKRFSNPCRQAALLRAAMTFRDSGIVQVPFDHYPSWRKHPLEATEYTAYIRALGWFLRWTGLPAHRGAQTLQLLFAVLTAYGLSRLITPSWAGAPFWVFCVSPVLLYLSVIVSPDMMLMVVVTAALTVLNALGSDPSWVQAGCLGLLAALAVRIKSSGFVPCAAILISSVLGGFSLWELTVVFSLGLAPLVWDVVSGRKNTILQVLTAQCRSFGYTREDERLCVSPEEIRRRTLTSRLKSIVELLGQGFATALNPRHRFGLFRSLSWFHPLGIAGMAVFFFVGGAEMNRTVLVFCVVYLPLFIALFAVLRRHYHFASRAGGTLAPCFIPWTVLLLARLDALGIGMFLAILVWEAVHSVRAFYGPDTMILYEPEPPEPESLRPVADALEGLLEPTDLLLLKYRDYMPLGWNPGAWQVPIELEKASLEMLCRYIDYYVCDPRYHAVYLVLPPDGVVFRDRGGSDHHIAEPALSKRFQLLENVAPVDGYRVYRAIRPEVFRDTSALEGWSVDRLKNSCIDFESLPPIKREMGEDRVPSTGD